MKLEEAHAGDRYGDIEVDAEKSMQVYREWLALAANAAHPDGLRHPGWLSRPFRPSPTASRTPLE